MTSEHLTFHDLKPVLPVVDGLIRLKRDIDEQNTVFCVCAVARQYQVSANDAKETFRRAQERGKVVVVRGDPPDLDSAIAEGLANPAVEDDLEDAIFIPCNPRDRESVWEQMGHAHESVERAYAILEDLDPTYRRGDHLFDQGMHDRFLDAFVRLKDAGALPTSIGNQAFNPQGMTRLMADCFHEESSFRRYLATPTILEVPGDYSGRIDELYRRLADAGSVAERQSLEASLREAQVKEAALIDAQFEFQSKIAGGALASIVADPNSG